MGHLHTKRGLFTQNGAPVGAPFGWKMGLEPTTPGTTIQCSNRLSYIHHVIRFDPYRCAKIIQISSTAKKIAQKHAINSPARLSPYLRPIFAQPLSSRLVPRLTSPPASPRTAHSSPRFSAPSLPAPTGAARCVAIYNIGITPKMPLFRPESAQKHIFFEKS